MNEDTPMQYSTPIDGFRLAYIDTRPDAAATTPTILLIHGWPGDSSDYREVLPLVPEACRVIVPDLRGFGRSDKHLVDPGTHYDAASQARALVALLDELTVDLVTIGGYDIGSRLAQLIAQQHPERVHALVLAPPLPGAGRRILDPDIAAETWYLDFQRSPLAIPLLDGEPVAVDAYIRYFWDRWSGPDFDTHTPEMAALIKRYTAPGAFEAAINWYRTGNGYVRDTVDAAPPAPEDRITTRTIVLWQDADRIYPRAWADTVGEYFLDFEIQPVDVVGHFVPLEAPDAFAAALSEAASQSPTERSRDAAAEVLVEPTTSVTIRAAASADGAALAQLDATAWPEALQVVPPAAATVPFFSDHRRVADVLVAADGETIVGYAHLERHIPIAKNAHVLHLNALLVDPAHYRAGLGSQLVTAVIGEARRRRVLKLGLRTLSTNPRAIALYERHGFTEEGRLRREFRQADGSWADDVWMARFLDN